MRYENETPSKVLTRALLMRPNRFPPFRSFLPPQDFRIKASDRSRTGADVTSGPWKVAPVCGSSAASNMQK